MPKKAETHGVARPARGHSPRGRTAARGYGSAWQRLSEQVRRERPVCEECGIRWSQCVDHVVSLARGGTGEAGNLRALCWGCHSAKTVRCDGGLGRRGEGEAISGTKAP